MRLCTTRSVVCLLASCTAISCTAIMGCTQEESLDPEKVGKMVLVDKVTGEARVADITNDIPAENPDTGKRTLFPGLYCRQCQEWHAVPPIDQINRIPNAGRCPKTNVPLTIDGPWPDSANPVTQGD